MSPIFAILVLVLASLATSDRLHCPFTKFDSKTRNCERSTHFIEYLHQNPEQRNLRPDIIAEKAEYYDFESLKYCCYEAECLESCGHNMEKIFDNDVSKNIQSEAGNYFREYPNFFQSINSDEFLALQFAKNDSRIMTFWKIRGAHLFSQKDRLQRQLKRMRG